MDRAVQSTQCALSPLTTEHNVTHHKHVSTEGDPATARAGESLWWFVARTIPGQFRDAAAIPGRKGYGGFRNPVYWGLTLEVTPTAQNRMDVPQLSMCAFGQL